ncbi:OmpA family protein [Myxococcota bacterium]|nr:OmpA family protein [Myxococcota bacterium]
MKKFLIASLMILSWMPGQAAAQNPYDFNLLPFKMSADPNGLITSEGARKMEHLQWFVGGMIGYAYDPMTVALNGDKIGSIVEHQVAMDLSFGIGIWKYFQLGANMQAILWQSGDNAADLGYPGSGDLKAQAISDFRLIPKVVFLQSKGPGLGLALVPILQFPTATGNAAAGEAGFMFDPRLIVDYRLGGGAVIIGQVGYRMRKPVEVDNMLLDDEITYSIGAEVPLMKHLSVVGEIYGSVGLDDAKADEDASIDAEEMPAEALLAARWRSCTGLIFTGGLGAGLSSGGQASKFRAFFSVGYSPKVKATPEVKDADGDGIPDDADACVNEAEDLNNFEDKDGCPDATKDTDKDGIFDIADKCVNEAEDKNNFEDEDGCPDGARDTDKDGVPDATDKCINEPEDKNNFEDEDGCPDAARDTDKDGIPDATDKCVNEPEDKDTFADEDGCPDADNDEDGFCDDNADIQKDLAKYGDVCKGLDKCPNEKETINGVEDDDGCPDKGKVKAIITRTNIQIMDKIFFNTGKTTIKRESFKVLDTVASILKSYPHIKLLEVQGHTDDVGDDNDNLKLSDGRAAEVMKYLVSKGVESSRLTSRGFGETMPMTDCSGLKRREQKECRGNNRRVEFKIANAPASMPVPPSDPAPAPAPSPAPAPVPYTK